ncbi:MAG: histidine kinase [Bacteroidota bacterium]
MNPHFLFNGLTVLYSLSLKDSRETSSAIIKLSDILRYVIYGSSNATVSLASEAKILRDYIDLQRYRIHPSTKVEYVEHLDNDVSIAPMIFLPLLENAIQNMARVLYQRN